MFGGGRGAAKIRIQKNPFMLPTRFLLLSHLVSIVSFLSLSFAPGKICVEQGKEREREIKEKKICVKRNLA